MAVIVLVYVVIVFLLVLGGVVARRAAEGRFPVDDVMVSLPLSAVSLAAVIMPHGQAAIDVAACGIGLIALATNKMLGAGVVLTGKGFSSASAEHGRDMWNLAEIAVRVVLIAMAAAFFFASSLLLSA